MQTALGILHGVDYLVTHLFLGSVIFYTLILPAGGADAEALELERGKKLRVFASYAFLTAVLWMFFSVFNMTDSWAPNNIWAGMSTTTFGHLWCARIVLLFILVLGVRRAFKSAFGRGLIFVSVLSLPVISALSGHAGSQTDYVIWRVLLATLHSIAVGVWTGGLFRLHQWLSLRLKTDYVRPEMSHSVVYRFSHFAMVSTGMIALTGVAMGYWAGVSPFHPFATTYGKLVFAKVALFTLTLAAAAINQFVHLRKWDPAQENVFARAIRREVRFELILVSCVFLVAGFLARTSI